MTRSYLLLAELLLLLSLLLPGASARRTRVGFVAKRSPSRSSSSSSSTPSLPPLAPRLFTSFHGQAPVSKRNEMLSFASLPDRNRELWKGFVTSALSASLRKEQKKNRQAEQTALQKKQLSLNSSFPLALPLNSRGPFTSSGPSTQFVTTLNSTQFGPSTLS